MASLFQPMTLTRSSGDNEVVIIDLIPSLAGENVTRTSCSIPIDCFFYTAERCISIELKDQNLSFSKINIENITSGETVFSTTCGVLSYYYSIPLNCPGQYQITIALSSGISYVGFFSTSPQ